MLLSTESKALESSRKTPMENSERSLEEEILSYKSVKANVVEWPFLKPHCLEAGSSVDNSARSKFDVNVICCVVL